MVQKLFSSSPDMFLFCRPLTILFSSSKDVTVLCSNWTLESQQYVKSSSWGNLIPHLLTLCQQTTPLPLNSLLLDFLKKGHFAIKKRKSESAECVKSCLPVSSLQYVISKRLPSYHFPVRWFLGLHIYKPTWNIW
jgi:hypothetical protein